MKNLTTILTFVLFVALILVSRWVDHPPNFSPLLAIALFCGARFGLRPWTFALPVVGLFLSDLVLGFHDLSLLIYLCLLPMVWIGSKWNLEAQRRAQIMGGIAAGFWAAVLFFFVTNFAVWRTSGLYPLTQEGLGDCFVQALPFFHYSIFSTWLFQGVLVGLDKLFAKSPKRVVVKN